MVAATDGAALDCVWRSGAAGSGHILGVLRPLEREFTPRSLHGAPKNDIIDSISAYDKSSLDKEIRITILKKKY